jgi:cytochrome P450
MATHGPSLTDAALKAMPYTEAIIKEILRNATPFGDRARAVAVFIVQTALRPFELGGYRVPQGWTVIGNLFQV